MKKKQLINYLNNIEALFQLKVQKFIFSTVFEVCLSCVDSELDLTSKNFEIKLLELNKRMFRKKILLLLKFIFRCIYKLRLSFVLIFCIILLYWINKKKEKTLTK